MKLLEAMLSEQRVLDWVGKFPEHWQVSSLGSQFSETRTKNVGLKVSQVLSLSYGNVVIKPVEKLKGLVPESFETYQIIRPGDIVIRPTDLQNDQSSLRVGMAHNEGIITSAYIAIRPKDQLDPRYASALLRAYDFLKVFYGFGSGLRQNLDFKHLKHIPIPVPPLAEQRLIVRYLDHAEIQIARVIQTRTELVKLLEEKRNAIVNELVMGRIGDSGNLIDSGIPWIGHIPEHWNLVPLRALVRPSKEIVGKSNTKHTLLSLTKRGVIVRDLVGMKGKFPASFDTYQTVSPGDFVFCLFDVDETPRTVGRSEHSGMITGAYSVYKPTSVGNPEYLLQQLLSFDNNKKLKPLYRGLRKVIPSSSLASMRVTQPPMEEQAAIVEEIRASTSNLDSGLASLRAEISLLKEYRTRLIADVVTGKRDVQAEASRMAEIDSVDVADVLSNVSSLVEDKFAEEADAN